ncbi:MAG: hypothetical protein NTY37_02585 [Methanothrix sp.]|nr:hypothetical protein [Methanothrix sp.]
MTLIDYIGNGSKPIGDGLAGITWTSFLARLANYGVDTFRLTEENLKAEAVIA